MQQVAKLLGSKNKEVVAFVVLESEQRSEAVDEFATSYPVAIGWNGR